MNKEYIKNIPVSKLKPYERNPRKNKHAVEVLAKSIQRVGNNDPIEVNEDYVILCGHTRKQALEKLNIKTTDIVMIKGLTEEQQNEYRITNNKTGEIAEWDFEVLEEDFSVEELVEFGFDINDITKEKESTICKSDREKRKELDVPVEEQKINIYKWISGFSDILVMFSGGKDSMALVADLLDNGIDKNKMRLVFNRTPLDYEGLDDFVYDFSKKVGIKVDIIGEKKTEEEKTEMFERNGFPLPYMSWCTGTWKVQPLNKYIKDNCKKKDGYILCQGWRREESEFRKSAKDRVIHGVHGIRMARPILDYLEQDVYNIIKKHEWELHKCYSYYDRLGCIYCFSKTREEWDLMRKYDPDTFFKALGYVADGMKSKNINTSYGFNTIRKMMGKETIKSK